MRQTRMEMRVRRGLSMPLYQPIHCVSALRGTRLVTRKFMRSRQLRARSGLGASPAHGPVLRQG